MHACVTSGFARGDIPQRETPSRLDAGKGRGDRSHRFGAPEVLGRGPLTRRDCAIGFVCGADTPTVADCTGGGNRHVHLRDFLHPLGGSDRQTAQRSGAARVCGTRAPVGLGLPGTNLHWPHVPLIPHGPIARRRGAAVAVHCCAGPDAADRLSAVHRCTAGRTAAPPGHQRRDLRRAHPVGAGPAPADRSCDGSQPEFELPIWDYLDRLVHPQRVASGWRDPATRADGVAADRRALPRRPGGTRRSARRRERLRPFCRGAIGSSTPRSAAPACGWRAPTGGPSFLPRCAFCSSARCSRTASPAPGQAHSA